MRINYKTHPILEKIEKGDLGEIKTLPSDIFFYQIEEEFRTVWEKHKLKFKSNITFVTKPFAEAADKTFSKMSDLLNSILLDGNTLEFSGTYMYSGFVFMIDFKAASNNVKDPNNKITMYVFLKEGEPLMWVSEELGRQTGWISQEIVNGRVLGFPINTQEEIRKLNQFTIFKCVLFHIFKSFAQVETKTLTAGKKIKDVNCRYYNETKTDILHLDSKWFTNLIKADGFTVRGHFRFQPKKKDGLWIKELIWINDFEKSGYTSKARILNEKTQKQ